MPTPVTKISCVSNVYIRQMVFEKAGDTEPCHDHVFDHQTLLTSGSLKSIIDGVESVFVAPQIIFVKAHVLHEFVALKDNTIAFCIHALRDGDGVGDIIDPEGLPKGISNPAVTMSKAKSLIGE